MTIRLLGAVGLALINTVMNRRFDLHLQRLHEDVTWASSIANERLTNLTYAFSNLGSKADLAALKQMSLMVRRQAFTLAIADIFLLLTVLFLSIILMLPLLKKPQAAGGGGGGGGH